MITSIFSIYDSKTLAYLPPFFMQTKPAAIRAITDVANEPGHQFNKHPGDYTLFYLGTFDDLTSQFEMEKTPINLCVCIELINQEQGS